MEDRLVGLDVAALAAGLGLWAFGPTVLAMIAPGSFDQQLKVALAKSAPAMSADSRQEIVLGFVALKPNRAIALAPNATRLRYGEGWGTRTTLDVPGRSLTISDAGA